MTSRAATAPVDVEGVLSAAASIAFLILALIVLAMLPRAEAPSSLPAPPLQSVAPAAAPTVSAGPAVALPVAPAVSTAAPLTDASADPAPRAAARRRGRSLLQRAEAPRSARRETRPRPTAPARSEPATGDLYEDAAAAGMTARSGRNRNGAESESPPAR